MGTLCGSHTVVTSTGAKSMRRAKSNLCSENLAQRMVALEEEAFQEFSDVFASRFRAFFLHKGLQTADAEDLAVSCVSDIAMKVDKYKPIPSAKFEHWVFALARHALVDWWRAQGKRKDTVPLVEEVSIETTTSSVEGDIEVILAVREALAQLSESDQAIINMRGAGAEAPEIGEQLGMRPNTVRVRYSRAKRELESLLKSDPRLSKILQRVEQQTRRI
jgi:RNA polymerase sigma factor (sigma-70 family)